jgi:hypothetical protein
MNKIRANNRALHLATRSGWYRFHSQGETWAQTNRALTYWNLTCLQVGPENTGDIYVGSEHSGLFESHNGGVDWKRTDPNVPRLTLTSLLALPNRVLAGTVPAALFSNNAGIWHELDGVRRGAAGSTFPPSPDIGARTRYLAADNGSPIRLFAGIEVGGVLVSDDGGLNWRPANNGLGDPDVHQICCSTKTAGLVVTANGEGIYRSLDRGEHWETITPAGPRTYGTAVTEDRAGNIYLGMARGRPNTWLRQERADAAVYCSGDSGVNWHLVVGGLAGGVLDLYPGIDGEGAFAATSEGEVLTVRDDGWETVIGNLPCINALALGA